MAKRGLFIGNIGPILRDISKRNGWALCIGAGTSIPMFPDWKLLVERLIAKDIGAKKAHELSGKLLMQYSPDALIQTAHDRLGCTDEKFFEILSNELYEYFRSQINHEQWNLFTEMLSARLGEHRRSKWISYMVLIRNNFPSLSALKIAEIISDTIGTNIAPTAIMSFNAEPVMASLINAFLRINKLTSKEAREGLGQRLDLITHSISNRKIQRIPYYFIHGLLPVPSRVKKRRMIHSTDKLVFSESEYLHMANTSFSWQSTVFLDLASTRSVVFIGVSLSDPNMRRWLSWAHFNRVKELRTRFSYSGPSTIHYWISRKPDTADERLWIESSVEHLGVRMVWLNDWSQLGEALNSMLGLLPKTA
jgi:hypothetical protein